MPKRMTQEEFENRVKEYTNDSVIVVSQYINKRTHVKIKCKTCGYEWEISPCSLMPSTTKHYTFIGCPECKYIEVECSYCHKTFKRLKSIVNKDNKTGYIYCSKECGNRHKNITTTNWVDSSNYRRNAFNYYPHKCCICGWEEDERVLEVHHLDEDRNNNDIENLRILCPICHKKLTLHLYTFEELINK